MCKSSKITKKANGFNWEVRVSGNDTKSTMDALVEMEQYIKNEYGGKK